MLTFLRSKKDRFDDGIRGLLGAQSSLAIQKITIPTIEGDMDLVDIAHQVKPRNDHSAEMNAWKISNLDNINRGLTKIVKAKEFEIPTFYGALWAKHIDISGEIVDYGLISLEKVTNDGVAFIVNAFQNTAELETMKYHGLGTNDATAEDQTNTGLYGELTTQYSPDNTRATGSTTNNGANIYRTEATNTLDGAAAIKEHGIFSQASTSGGVLLDRSVFSVINLSNGDSLKTTYDLTFNAGG